MCSLRFLILLIAVGCARLASADIAEELRQNILFRDGHPSNPATLNPYLWTESSGGQERLLFRKVDSLNEILHRATPESKPSREGFHRAYCEYDGSEGHISDTIRNRKPMECVLLQESGAFPDITDELFECLGTRTEGHVWRCPSHQCYRAESTVETSRIIPKLTADASMTHVAVPPQCQAKVQKAIAQSAFKGVDGLMDKFLLNKLPTSLLPSFVLRDEPPYWTWMPANTISHVQMAIMGFDTWMVVAKGHAHIAVECSTHVFKESISRPAGLPKVYPFFENLDLLAEESTSIASAYGKRYAYELTPGVSILIPAGCMYQLMTFDREFSAFTGPFLSEAIRNDDLRSVVKDGMHNHLFASGLYEAKSRPALRVLTLLLNQMDYPYSPAWLVGTPMSSEMIAQVRARSSPETKIVLCVGEDMTSELLLSLWLKLPDMCNNNSKQSGGAVEKLACEDVLSKKFGLYLRSKELTVPAYPAVMVYNNSQVRFIHGDALTGKGSTAASEGHYGASEGGPHKLEGLSVLDLLRPVYKQWAPPAEEAKAESKKTEIGDSLPNEEMPGIVSNWYQNAHTFIRLPKDKHQWWLAGLRLVTVFALLSVISILAIVTRRAFSFFATALRKKGSSTKQTKRQRVVPPKRK